MKNLNSGGVKSGKVSRAMRCDVCSDMAEGIFKTKFKEEVNLCLAHLKQNIQIGNYIGIWRERK